MANGQPDPPRAAGFGASLGYTVAYLSVLVLIPLAACFAKAMTLSPQQFWNVVSTPRAVAAYKLSVGASLLAAVASVVLGLLVAWVLSRYEFPLKRLVDSLVDLPFALPTAVAGLVYSSLYVAKGLARTIPRAAENSGDRPGRHSVCLLAGRASCWC